MSRLLRVLVAWCVVVAIPLQALATAGMSVGAAPLGPLSDAVSPGARSPAHAHAHEAAHDDVAAAGVTAVDPHAAAGHAGCAHDPAERSPDKRGACAACCAAAAPPPDGWQPVAGRATHRLEPLGPVGSPAFLTGGPERPPKHVVA